MIERHPITSRDQWLAMRRQDITASVAAALLGEHPYVTPYGLWCLKTGRVPESDLETPSMQRGRLLEPVAINLLSENKPDWSIFPPAAYYRDPDARLGATPDTLVRDAAGKTGTVQVKNVEQSVFRKRWRDPEGVTELPLWIAVQAIIEAHLVGSDWAAVAALVVGHGLDLHIIDVPIHQGVIDKVRAATAEFWEMVDSGRQPDPDWRRDAALASRFVVPEGSIDLGDDNEVRALLEQREQLSLQMKADKESRDEIDGTLKNKIGTAESAHLPGWKLIFKPVDVKEYVVKAKTTRPLKIYRTERP